MLRFHSAFRSVVFLLAISVADPAVAGKKGRGRKPPAKKPPQKVHHGEHRQQAARSDSKIHPSNADSQLRNRPATRTGASQQAPWSTQRQNEMRKLNHRLETADHLDRLAERNGNPRLHDTAERMRQKAFEHYEKRLAMIDTKGPQVSAAMPENSWVESELPAEPASTAAADPWASRLAEDRRELLRRLDASQELLKWAEQNGSDQLRAAASRMEQQALQQFYDRLGDLDPTPVQPPISDEPKSVLVRPITGQ
jgi:hypothetical protein